MEKIVETTIGDLKEGDKVLCPDGEWREFELLDIQEKDLYKVKTSSGSVVCSYDHQWTIFINGEKRVFSTIEMFNVFEKYKGSNVGKENGPILEEIIYEGVGKCRCISLDTEDHLFQILTDEGKGILSHNCAGRLVCGQLGSIASGMALGSSLATTIDGKHKGSGLVSFNGNISNVQYYFENQKWILDWYKKHGKDEKGFPIGYKEKEYEVLLGDDEEEFSISDNDQHYEFSNIEKDVINRKEQKFENL